MYAFTETATDLPVQAYNDSHPFATECFAIIYLADTLDKQRQASVIDKLTTTIGIDSAHFTPGRDHLLVARYNRMQIRTQDIITQLHQQGLKAVIAGC
ncbi:MAG TPA: hypothetical protein ENI64_12475 [Gammaproteobacteria bacterium]|nr:hypothetical protein [Gammaproteobacteria bacterium]